MANTSVLPLEAGNCMVIMRIGFVLPAPLGPSRPKISPGATVRVDVVQGHHVAERVPQAQNR
jgi:hypothetical protein